MTDRQALFIFSSPENAFIFVRRLVLELTDLAILRVSEAVIVIDGGEENRRERILQLARTSSAIRAVIDSVPRTL